MPEPGLNVHNIKSITSRSYAKEMVPGMTDRFCCGLDYPIRKVPKSEEALTLFFNAHYNLVAIYPFGHGIDLKARLFMN